MSQVCQLFANKAWHPISLEDALSKYSERDLRCPECHGALRVHKASKDGSMAAHFEHKVGHKGCALGSYFDGISRMHPRPLVR